MVYVSMGTGWNFPTHGLPMPNPTSSGFGVTFSEESGIQSGRGVIRASKSSRLGWAKSEEQRMAGQY